MTSFWTQLCKKFEEMPYRSLGRLRENLFKILETLEWWLYILANLFANISEYFQLFLFWVCGFWESHFWKRSETRWNSYVVEIAFEIVIAWSLKLLFRIQNFLHFLWPVQVNCNRLTESDVKKLSLKVFGLNIFYAIFV